MKQDNNTTQERFTQGEWIKGGQQVNFPYEAGIFGKGELGGEFLLAKVFAESQSQAEANARLIAEAKNMYEMIKQLMGDKML